MKAVTRCLTVFAAVVLVGACGGDPTADDAGADLTIRATPGAIWLNQGATATVTVEAVDAVGSTVGGSWKVSAATAGVTAVADSEFQVTNAGGPVGYKARFFVTADSVPQDGSVTITGTGGSKVIPVRIAPDTTAFAATLSNATPAIAEVVTATAPAGFRFSANTAVSFTGSNGLAAPSVTGFSADSTQVSFLPAPGATGQVRFTNVGFVTAPGQTTPARSIVTLTAPPLTSVAATFSNPTPAANTPVTLTMPGTFKIRPTTTFTGGAGAISGIVLSIAADSNSASILPPPGNAPITLTNLQFIPIPSLLATLPTSGNVTVGAPADMGTDALGAGGTDPTPLPHFAAPTVVGNSTGFYDLMTLGAPDYVGDGGIATSQGYVITYASAGTYEITLSWDNGADVDLFLTDIGFNNIVGQSFLAAGLDETVEYEATAGDQTILLVNMFAGTVPATVRVAVKRIG